MNNASKGRRMIAALVPVLLGLVACATPVATVKPEVKPEVAAERQAQAESRIQRDVQELLANQAAGRVRTVAGVGYVLAPITVYLANGEVSLIPSTPGLEAALARIQRQWLAGRRQPLPYEAFQTAFARLTAQRKAVGQAGGEGLIRFAKTDDQGRFIFEQVPEGRWLLVADMGSPVSILLWTVPVQVESANPPTLFLVEGNLLLEARKDEQIPPPR